MNEAYIKWSSFPAVVREARRGGCLTESEMASGRFKAKVQAKKTPTGVMEMYVSVFFVPGFIKQYRTLPYASYVKQ